MKKRKKIAERLASLGLSDLLTIVFVAALGVLAGVGYSKSSNPMHAAYAVALFLLAFVSGYTSILQDDER